MTDETSVAMVAQAACWSRRQFLFTGGSVAGAGLLAGFLAGRGLGVRHASHPRHVVGHLSKLVEGTPQPFQYPHDDVHSASILVKLGVPAHGGVGPHGDIVAVNTLCTHQGGSLDGRYDHRYRVAGPCPLHLTTFDLTRHGMVVSGHATEGLPQVVLETEGDEIYAVGVMGLIYGYHDNEATYDGATT
jgi:arsenite oxidase small subunit